MRVLREYELAPEREQRALRLLVGIAQAPRQSRESVVAVRDAEKSGDGETSQGHSGDDRQDVNGGDEVERQRGGVK